MSKGRLEAFSDGGLAIIITIMVLELKAPQQPELQALRPLIPGFLSYLLSFTFVGIYWNNHHHLLQAARHVNGPTLWANLHLLFWLSLIPFVTNWMGQQFGAWTVIKRVLLSSPKVMWQCRCECGTVRTVAGHSLTSGERKPILWLPEEGSQPRRFQSGSSGDL